LKESVSTSRSRILWLIPLLMALHNAEEALFFPRYLPLVLASLPEGWRAVVGPISPAAIWGVLMLVTLIPFILALWAARRPEQTTPVWLLLLIQGALLLNAFWHVSIAIFVFEGYAPGLVTAVLLNLPGSVYVFRRALRGRWLSR
jgi:nucleoside recognition membrane protein YjiH